MTNYDELASLLRLSDPDSVYAQAASAIEDLQRRLAGMRKVAFRAQEMAKEQLAEREALERQIAEKDEVLQEAVELQFRCYTAVHVLKTMLKRAKLGGGANVAAELLTDLAKANPEFPARSSLRAAIVAKQEKSE